MVRREKAQRAIQATVLALGLGVGASGVEAAVCMRPGDEMAVNARVMQSELMVAALACDQAVDYNAVVRKFQPDLTAGGTALRRMFRDTYGASSEHHLGRFVTVLANDAAQRSATEQAAFCADAARIFERVKGMDRAQFRAFIVGTEYAGRHGLSFCGERDSAER